MPLLCSPHLTWPLWFQEIDVATSKANMDKVTPRSLYVLIAVLLATGTMSMEDLLKRVSPGIISLAAKEK